MSIADKLTAIAQNQQTVYDAGKAKILNSIDSLSYFFSDNSAAMALLPYILQMDLSHINNWQYAFLRNTQITEFHAPATMECRLPHYMFQGATNLVTVSGLDQGIVGPVLTGLFNGCTSLVDCGTLNFQGTSYATRTFYNCTALEETRITGNINLDISFAESAKLSADSIQSIIDHLADRTGTSALTLTLHGSVGSKLTDAQKTMVTAKNWTLVY